MQRRSQCPNLDLNLENCGCTYPSCDKKGKCCECIRFHRERNELPGCLFAPKIEKTYDRSVERFVASRR
ncbi:MAG: DUF6485 family protein [Candidatus Bathyarchaeia archaeon]